MCSFKDQEFYLITLVSAGADLITVEQLRNSHFGDRRNWRCTEEAVKYIENLRPKTMKIEVAEINALFG